MTAVNSHAQVVAADSHEPKAHASTHSAGSTDPMTNPQFTTIELGAASDTTIARASAGNVTVEGNALYRAGGTDVPVADGGTGSSTAAGAATNLGLGTGDSPQHTAVNLGHASDTTVGRTSAGVINVEGKDVYMVGGTDVAVADGGTGSSTAANARTALDVEQAIGGRSLSDVGTPASGDLILLQDVSAGSALKTAAFSTFSGGGSADLAGKELDYAEVTSDVSVTTVDGGGFDTVVSGNAVAYDGSTVVLIQFYCNAIQVPATASNNYLYLVLFDGATQLGNLTISLQANSASIRVPVGTVERRLTPTNATHTYHVKAAIGSAGTGTIRAGNGASGNAMPAFLRITRVTS